MTTDKDIITGMALANEAGKALDRPSAAAFETPWDDDVDQTLPDSPPWIKVLYDNVKGKPDGAANGMLFNTVTGEVASAMKVLLIHARIGMIMFPDSFSIENDFRCRSNDGIVPAGDGSDPQPGPCRKRLPSGGMTEWCPHARWTENSSGRFPPDCSTKYQLMFWDLASNIPVMTSCQKAENAAFRSLKTTLKAKAVPAMTRHGNPTGIPAYLLMPIEMSTMKKAGPKGVYYPKTFRVLDEPVDLALVKDLVSMLDSLRAVATRVEVEAEQADRVSSKAGLVVDVDVEAAEEARAGRDPDELPF